MSEYHHVEKPFLTQLASLGWTVIDQGHSLYPFDPAPTLRENFREILLPNVFRDSIRSLNRTSNGDEWLAARDLDDLANQLLRHPARTLLEANEAVHKLFFKAQVDRNELTANFRNFLRKWKRSGCASDEEEYEDTEDTGALPSDQVKRLKANVKELRAPPVTVQEPVTIALEPCKQIFCLKCSLLLVCAEFTNDARAPKR
jgi:hypothetical protein